jgi:hypothetical protein
MMTYMIQCAIYLGGCFAFYKLLLQKETFYRLNRYILVTCIALSFLLPLVHIPGKYSWQQNNAESFLITGNNEPPLSNVIIPSSTAAGSIPGTGKTISLAVIGKWAVYLYWIGVMVFAINFLVQLSVLLYRAYSRPVIKDGPVRIVELAGDKAPCSFVNNVFINPEKYDWETYSQVLTHEKVHVSQWHSFDILVAEMMLIFQWFNPFAWLYRRELENNLEFLTDDEVLHQNIDRSSYQMSLLKVSAPHFPMAITTNYNQQLLKKRLVMMDRKRSNIHTGWKYFFILPLFFVLAGFVNTPMRTVAYAPDTATKENVSISAYLQTEGNWFGTIRNDRIQFILKGDGDDPNSLNGSIFNAGEFNELPKDKAGRFTLTYDAGTIEFNGKFDGNEGTGRYKFTADNEFADFLKTQNVTGVTNDRDLLTFFLVNVKRSYVSMLRRNGYGQLRKNDLVAMSALHVDEAYIKSVRDNGFPNIGMNDLVSFKSLGIDAAYINTMRKAGYDIPTPGKLIGLKAMHVAGTVNANNPGNTLPGKAGNKQSIAETANPVADNTDKETNNGINQVIRQNIVTNPPAKNNFPAAGNLPPYPGLENITTDYVKMVSAMGYTRVTTGQLQRFKKLDVTGDYINSFRSLGYNDISINMVIALKANQVTAGYLQTFIDAGYKNVPLGTYVSMKSLRITPATIDEYKKQGFSNITLAEVIEAQTSGTVPSLKQRSLN